MEAGVYYNSILAGLLSKDNNKYTFQYEKSYLDNASLPAISLTLPKRKESYTSEYLFPFFYGLLAEGENKNLQCRTLKIDENDHFTRLIKTAGENTIGAITVKEL
jgi:serine/threonine-protein kinase HipA